VCFKKYSISETKGSGVTRLADDGGTALHHVLSAAPPRSHRGASQPPSLPWIGLYRPGARLAAPAEAYRGCSCSPAVWRRPRYNRCAMTMPELFPLDMDIGRLFHFRSLRPRNLLPKRARSFNLEDFGRQYLQNPLRLPAIVRGCEEDRAYLPTRSGAAPWIPTEQYCIWPPGQSTST
jgi:hypothetical protein